MLSIGWQLVCGKKYYNYLSFYISLVYEVILIKTLTGYMINSKKHKNVFMLSMKCLNIYK